MWGLIAGALLAGIVGFGFAFWSPVAIPTDIAPYLSLAALAGIDSLVGGVRSAAEGKFRSDVFVSGFIANTILAVILAYLGELLGQNLTLAAVVALGGRIFVNLSIARRLWLDGRGAARIKTTATE